ncbi:MAG: preprotein translocase subunit SecG [Prevotellaceae bacterium]|jgi:preprotein translocase subunit SecG|nr:preprotein translocase subunit SecG [Prevotellaceae bacterium]
MYTFLTIIIVFAAVVLTGVVLIQNSKGGGLAAGFASANQVFGVRKTTDKIEKLTWGLIAAIVVLSVTASGLHDSGVQKSSSVDVENAQSQAPAQPQMPVGE